MRKINLQRNTCFVLIEIKKLQYIYMFYKTIDNLNQIHTNQIML